MNIITAIQDFFASRDSKELWIYYGIFMGLFVMILGIVIYSHSSQMTKLTNELKAINKNRDRAQIILQKNKAVIEQQEAVKTIIAQEPNFYIGQYFTELVKQLNLEGSLTRDPERSEHDIGNEYLERKLGVTLSNMTMQQLCNLLYKIEQTPRVYTKELKMIKNIKNGLLDVTLIIATLEAQPSLSS